MTLLLSLLFGPPPEHPHYSGSFGNTTQDLVPYDQLTRAEHDALGAFWMA